MAQVEVGKQVNEVEGHEREAEDDAQPFLESFAWERQKIHIRRKNSMESARRGFSTRFLRRTVRIAASRRAAAPRWALTSHRRISSTNGIRSEERFCSCQRWEELSSCGR